MIPTRVIKYSRITEKEIVAINEELKFKPYTFILGREYPFRNIGLRSRNFLLHTTPWRIVYYLNSTVVEWFS